jgi:hypothetical protein
MRSRPDSWVEIRAELFGQLRAAGLFFSWVILMTSVMLWIIWASVPGPKLESEPTATRIAENGRLPVPPSVSKSASAPRATIVKNKLVSR